MGRSSHTCTLVPDNDGHGHDDRDRDHPHVEFSIYVLARLETKRNGAEMQYSSDKKHLIFN